MIYSFLLECSPECAEVNNFSLYETDISLIFTAAPLFVSGEFPNKFRRVETLDIRKWFWFLKQSSGNGNRFRKGDISAI